MRTLHRAVAAGLLLLAAIAWAAPAEAQTVPFKVFITELWQLDTGVDPGIGLIGDYYAKVTINGVQASGGGSCNDESTTGMIVPFQLFKNLSRIPECGSPTPWVFSRDVPAGQTVHVKIQLFDSDLVFDDEADLKFGEGSAIEMDVNPTTGQWTGDVVWPQTCSRPQMNIASQNVNLCFQMSFDSDDDGLLDVWELSGVDTDNDGVNDLDLPGMGAHPLHKDIFLELDHLVAANHTHAPRLDAITRVVTSFANAPLVNADGTSGAQLHVDVGTLFGAGTFQVAGAAGVTGTYGNLGGGNAIGEAGNEIIEAFHDAKDTAVKVADLKAANFAANREGFFRYTIFGHQTNTRRALNDCTSGQAHRTRREFLVTLGGTALSGVTCWTADAAGNSVGSSDEQAGTLMHEMGHTLGLRHGGEGDVNNKPNYLSVMNYSFQACEVPNAPLLPGFCDYSRLVMGSVLPDLDEVALDECAGIGGGLGLGAMDWNADGAIQGPSMCTPAAATATADVNNDGVCITAGQNGVLQTTAVGDDTNKDNGINDGPNRRCDTTVKNMTDDVQVTAAGDTPTQPNPLKSFDDWNAVTPGLLEFTDGFGSGSSPIDQEPDPETRRESRRYLSEMTAPAIIVDATGPATAKPGDVLTYDAKVTNTGRGPALAAVLRQTRPDGTVATSEVGTIPVGDEVIRTTTFTMPAAACPGSFTGASAALSFRDFVGNPLTASDTVPLQVLDVSAPVVSLVLAPAGLWPPNHKFVVVTATLTVTDNCDQNPAVRLISITSNEAATGVIGTGDQGPDFEGAAIGTDDRTFSLRAERATSKGSTGRVYTVTYRVTDASANVTVKTATVTVPISTTK
jgi:uncharacterized repeat protein (TIGR01451 family)